MKSGEVISKLAKAGWIALKKRGKGSHTLMRHPDAPGTVTIPHGELKTGTVISIEKFTNIKLR